MKFNNNISPFLRILSLVLIVSVLLPSAIKLSHTFNHHTHQVCKNDEDASNTHFHEVDIDCEFYKFKLSPNQYFLVYDYDKSPEIYGLLWSSSHYISFNNHQQFTRQLRGPPSLI